MWWEHLDFASSNINAHLLSSVSLLEQNAEKCVFHTQQVKHAQGNYNHANTFIIGCFQLTGHELCWLEIQMWFVTRTRRAGRAQVPFSHQAASLPVQNWEHSSASQLSLCHSWLLALPSLQGCLSSATTSTEPPLEPFQLQDNLRQQTGSKGEHFALIVLLCLLYDINHCREREKWHSHIQNLSMPICRAGS